MTKFTNDHKTCVPQAIAAFIGAPTNPTILATQLNACTPPITDEGEISDIRHRAAADPSVTSANYKNMLGLAADVALTTENLLDQSKNKKNRAELAMAKKCFDCLTANAAATNCPTLALADFKTAYGNNPPSDQSIVAGLPKYAAKFSYDLRKGCGSETTFKAACQNNADAAGTLARCEVASALTGTQREQALEDRTNAALGETCDSSTPSKATACFAKRKTALEDLTGGGTLTDADVRVRLKETGANEASAAMEACPIDFTKSVSVVKIARTACLALAKAEYIKFDSKGVGMSDEELASILEDKAMEQATNDFAACAKDTCSTPITCTVSQKSTCMVASFKSVAGLIGRSAGDYDSATADEKKELRRDFDAKLTHKAGIVAADKRKLCQAAAVNGVDCKTEYKNEFAARTGTAVGDISDKAIEEAEFRKGVEDSLNAMKTFAEETCTDSAAVCQEQKRAFMSKTLGKEVDTTEMEQYAQEAVQNEVMAMQKACIEQEISRNDCDVKLKAAMQKVTGKVVTNLELNIKKKAAEGKVMSTFAKDIYKDDTKTAAQKESIMIAKLAATTGRTNLKKEDLAKATTKAAQDKIGELMKTTGSTSAAEMKSAIEEQTGRVVTDAEVDHFKKVAVASNMANVMLAAKRAGLTPAEIAVKFTTALRLNLDTGSADTIDPVEMAKVKENAKRQAIRNIMDADVIDFTDVTTNGIAARKVAVDAKIASTSEAIEAMTGKAPDKFEAERYMKEEATNSMMEMSKGMGLTTRVAVTSITKGVVVSAGLASAPEVGDQMKIENAPSKTCGTTGVFAVTAKDSTTGYTLDTTMTDVTDVTLCVIGSAGATAAQDIKLRDMYRAAIGDKDVELYEIKAKIKNAAKSSDQVRDIMKDTTKTEAEKKVLFANEMEKITGSKPSAIEMTTLIKGQSDTNMFNIIKARSDARGGTVAGASGTDANKKAAMAAENTARKEAFIASRGRAPTSDAEVKKSFADAMVTQMGMETRACITSSSETKTKAECVTAIATKYKGMDATVDETEVKMRLKESELNAMADSMNECARSTKSDTECRAKAVMFLTQGRGESENVPSYESENIIRKGAAKQLGPVMAECGTDTTCKDAAFDDFKKKSLSPTMTKADFNAEVKTAAAQEGLEIAKGCDKTDATIDCGAIVLAAFVKASGGNANLKKSEAVTAVKDAMPGEIAKAVTSCSKTPAECRTLMKKKMKESKPWDKRSGVDAIVGEAEVERIIKRGAMSVAQESYKACRRLIVTTDAAVKKTKRTECKTAFKTVMAKVYPKASTDDRVLKEAEKKAQVSTASSTLSLLTAETDVSASDFVPKTRKELRTLLINAIGEGAPVDDETGKNAMMLLPVFLSFHIPLSIIIFIVIFIDSHCYHLSLFPPLVPSLPIIIIVHTFV